MTGSDARQMTFRGLVTDPNELAISGDGAMRQFVNGVLTRPALAQKRRGVKWSATNSTPINKFFNYDGSLLFHCGTGILKSIAAGTITSLPGNVNVNPPSGRLRSCIAGKNLYLAGTVPWRVSGAAGTPVAAGGLYAPGFDPMATVWTTTTGTLMPIGSAAAWRYLFGYIDAKGVEHLGEVSPRLVLINGTSYAASPTLRAIVPSAATTSHFVRFYRSEIQADSTIVPSDDLQLVFEQQLKTTDISNGYVELIDITPEALRGGFIYTAPNGGDGIDQTHRAPPGCLEVCAHRDRVWYGNTTQPAEFLLKLLAVVGTNGVQGGDVLRLAGISSPFSMTAVRDFAVSLTRVGTTVTGTTGVAHGYSTGDYVGITPGAPDLGRGPFQITVTGATTFTYTEAGAGVTDGTQAVHKTTSTGLAAGTYVLRTTGTVSSQIERTALELVAAFNRHTSNTELWMQYLSGPTDTPGEILIRGRTAATTSFTVWAGTSTLGAKRDAWSPQLLQPTADVSLTRAANVVTATVTGGGTHSFKVGEQVTIMPGGAGSGGSTFGTGAFTITGVTGTTFTYAETGTNGTLAAQVATLTPTDLAESTCEQKGNRVYFSRSQKYEATTRDGWLDVGPANGVIKAMCSQRGQIWVWLTTGIFKITGLDEGSFRADVVDAAIALRATESVVLFSNRCWGLTDRGVVAVSEAGIEVMSPAITDDLMRAWQTVTDEAAALETAGYGVINFEADCFATPYESDSQYILHIPSVYALDGNPALNAASKYGGCPLAYVFNTKSGGWSLWDWGGVNPIVGFVNAKRAAIVSATEDRLYVGDGYNGTGADAYIMRERKALISGDYRDTTARNGTFDLAGSNGSTTVTAHGANTFEVGDVLLLTNGTNDFPAGSYTVVTANASGFTYVNSKPAVGTPTATNRVFFQERGIGITWTWVLQTQRAPEKEKRWDELAFIFGQRESYFPTNRANSQVAFDLALANPTNSVAAFEVPSQGEQISRVWPNAEVARGSRLLVTITHDTIDEAFDLAGINVKAEVLGGAPTR